MRNVVGHGSTLSAERQLIVSVEISAEMGLYDREVKKILGINIWEEILKEVRRGAIVDHCMRDISALLADVIQGNHLHRMQQSNGHCDEVEMREILSDWYKQALFGYDSKRAIGELVMIFNDPSVSLPHLASYLQDSPPHLLLQNLSQP